MSRTAGDLAERGVRLLRGGRVDARADAAALGRALERGRLGLRDLVLAALADQLLDGGHRVSVFVGWWSSPVGGLRRLVVFAVGGPSPADGHRRLMVFAGCVASSRVVLRCAPNGPCLPTIWSARSVREEPFFTPGSPRFVRPTRSGVSPIRPWLHTLVKRERAETRSAGEVASCALINQLTPATPVCPGCPGTRKKTTARPLWSKWDHAHSPDSRGTSRVLLLRHGRSRAAGYATRNDSVAHCVRTDESPSALAVQQDVCRGRSALDRPTRGTTERSVMLANSKAQRLRRRRRGPGHSSLPQTARTESLRLDAQNGLLELHVGGATDPGCAP